MVAANGFAHQELRAQVERLTVRHDRADGTSIWCSYPSPTGDKSVSRRCLRWRFAGGCLRLLSVADSGAHLAAEAWPWPASSAAIFAPFPRAIAAVAAGAA